MTVEELGNDYVLVHFDTPGDTGLLRVWHFCDAPEPLQRLSYHGGDEDWLLLIPPGYGHHIGWAEGGLFGCCDVQEITLPSGWQVWIGAHS